MSKQKIYIVLTRSNTILSNIIHLVKNDEYTHASLSLDEKLNTMYSFGRKYFHNPFIGVFRKEVISHNLKGIVLEIEVDEEQYFSVVNMLNEFILNSQQYKYNYKGLLYNVLNKETKNKKRFLCSEFVYHILKESGIIDFNKARNLVSPQQLLEIEHEIVYKGDLLLLAKEDKIKVSYGVAVSV